MTSLPTRTADPGRFRWPGDTDLDAAERRHNLQRHAPSIGTLRRVRDGLAAITSSPADRRR